MTPKNDFRLSRVTQHLLGLASALPLVYLVGFIAFVGAMASGSGPMIQDLFPILMVLHVAVILGSYALIGVYLWIAVKRGLSGGAIAAWSAALFFGQMLAFPVAWYFLAREEDEGPRPWEWREEHAHGTESIGC